MAPVKIYKGKAVDEGYCCSRCGRAASKKIKERDRIHRGWKEKTVFMSFKDFKAGVTKCKCGEPFYTAIGEKKVVATKGGRSSFASRRVVSVGKKIRRLSEKGIVFDTFIVDEAHEYREASTLQHRNMADITVAAKNIVAMSGTWTSGNARDLFYLFWKLMPHKLKEYGHKYYQLKEWEECYGASSWRETTIAADKKQRNSFTAAGICPRVFPRFMVENFVFLKLNDMERGRKLQYKEEKIVTPMSDEMRDAYLDYEKTVRETIIDLANKIIGIDTIQTARDLGRPLTDDEIKEIKGRVYLQFARTGVRSRFRWLDAPTNQVSISAVDTTGTVHTMNRTVDKPFSYGATTAKEEDFIHRCKKAPHGVLVYIENTGDSTVADRLISLLDDAGIKGAFMEASIPVAARSEWMEKAWNNGNKVVFCNPRLVATGLNLYDYTDIIFYQPCLSVFTARQGCRRSLRLMQTKPVNVAFYAHDNSIQKHALDLLLEAMDIARQAEGDVDSYGIETGEGSNDNILKILINSYSRELMEQE